MLLPKSFTTVTNFSKWLALVLFVLFPVFGFYLGMQYEQLSISSQVSSTQRTCAIDKPACSESEKQKIDTWIKKDNLNEYGDSTNTVYAGGTPLFNESTGQSIELYQYILEKHPDRPWDN